MAKVFSQRQGYRSLVNCRARAEINFRGIIPSVSGRINFITLLRALGMETDMDIVKSVSDNPEIIKFMLDQTSKRLRFPRLMRRLRRSGPAWLPASKGVPEEEGHICT